MDGTLAVVFLLTGLIDMAVNHCDRGCMSAVWSGVRHTVSAGQLVFEADVIGQEAYYRLDAPVSFGPFRPAVGLSVDTHGDLWIGAGAVNELTTAEGHAYAELSFMPGRWIRGETGPVLGYPLEFRSGLEAGIYRENGDRVGVSLDHRSNGSLGRPNPGLETVLMRYSRQLQ
ncbi:acyloxyacyl hydrolase [Aliiroseovarius crassostreae]|uniref:acyloxyacyl hydrolase n=1 Tax=Aliiroseovarius crassostreae TaxID=154981 RepID=UPI002206BDD9|nr:acyloxyacyl hydrolase [Aliiroseovarius crassostreae]UWP91950.1 acyloxyacyl hydrolase [Aliiroseovarius crassostreae]UWQ01445.1 acyloxyacyl hydrolase [Aliiroseovarius crassostreae]